MKEIEILVQVFDEEQKVLDKLSEFEFIGDKKTIDTYYFDPLRDELKPDNSGRLNACFRVRQKEDSNYITYKKDHFDGNKWLYSDEYETHFHSLSAVEEIVKSLGLQELIIIDNLKKTYKHKDYIIEFEKVKNLGLFLEVEYSTDDDIDIQIIKNEIQEFINSFGFSVSEELNAGKPELMLKLKKFV